MIGVRLFAVVFLVVSLLAFYDYQRNRRIRVVGFNPSSSTASLPVKEALAAAAAMLAGVIFGSLHHELQQASPQASMRTALRKTFHRTGLYRSLLIAPLAYAGVYAAARQQPDVVIALLFAFENGFFIDNVFRRKDEPT